MKCITIVCFPKLENKTRLNKNRKKIKALKVHEIKLRWCENTIPSLTHCLLRVTLVDFTLSDARRYHLSTGGALGVNGSSGHAPFITHNGLFTCKYFLSCLE